MKSAVPGLNRTELKFLLFLLITLFLSFGAAVSSANARVTDWEISPENPKIGDTLIISGFASPEEEIEVAVSFEKTVPVYLKEYTYEFENIEFLNFNNLFTVRAEEVENLKVKIKTVIPKTESAWADEGIATVSYSGTSPGKYKVRVEGIAEDGSSGVRLKLTTIQKLKAGKDGKFSYRYGTGLLPSNRLEIKLENSEREILFDAKGNAIMQTSAASSQIMASEEPEDRKTSKRMALTGTEPEDLGLTEEENDEKDSIHLTGSSWDEGRPVAAAAGKSLSKELAEKKETRKQGNKIITPFYLFAGSLAGFGILLAVQKRK